MALRSFTSSVKTLVSVAVVSAAMIGFAAPAHADNWGGLSNIAKNAAESYLQAKYSAELQGHNVQLTKSEFGNKPVKHLAFDVLVDGVFGGTLVYNPKTNEVKLWGSTGGFSEAKEAKTVNPYTSGCRFTYGSVELIGGVPTCIPGSSVGSASTAPVPYLISTTPGTDPSCTWTPKGQGAHTC